MSGLCIMSYISHLCNQKINDHIVKNLWRSWDFYRISKLAVYPAIAWMPAEDRGLQGQRQRTLLFVGLQTTWSSLSHRFLLRTRSHVWCRWNPGGCCTNNGLIAEGRNVNLMKPKFFVRDLQAQLPTLGLDETRVEVGRSKNFFKDSHRQWEWAGSWWAGSV